MDFRAGGDEITSLPCVPVDWFLQRPRTRLFYVSPFPVLRIGTSFEFQLSLDVEESNQSFRYTGMEDFDREERGNEDDRWARREFVLAFRLCSRCGL